MTHDLELWFLTGSQSLYGDETLAKVAEQSQTVAAVLQGAAEIPLPIVWEPVLTTSDAIRQAAREQLRIMLPEDHDYCLTGIQSIADDIGSGAHIHV